MGLMANIKYFFIGLFDKTGAAIKKLWTLAKPFLQEVLRESAQRAFESLQTLAIEAVKYVLTQGLPSDKAKQDAFKDYMVGKAKDQVDLLKDYEINLLRETALAIVKKAQES